MTRYVGPQQAYPPLGEWANRGACRTVETAVFYPSPITRAGREYDEARAVCAVCPVIDDCRAYGLEHNPPGMWGGLSEWDRRRRNQRPSAPAPGTASGWKPRCPGCRWPTPGIPVAGRHRECPRCGIRWTT